MILASIFFCLPLYLINMMRLHKSLGGWLKLDYIIAWAQNIDTWWRLLSIFVNRQATASQESTLNHNQQPVVIK